MNLSEIFDNSITENDYEKWLGQFDKIDIPIITTLVQNIKYFSLKKTENSIEKLFTEVIATTKTIERVLFIPVGYVVKSGSIVAYTFRKQNQIPENKFIPYTDLNNDTLLNIDFLVFIDDFIGTGHQCCEVWRDLSRKLKNLNSNPNLIYATIATTKQGKDEVESKTTFKVLTSCQIENSEIPFHDDSKIFTNSSDKERAKEIVSKYGKNLYPKYPLGYKNNSLLVGFYYSTPNNTLPIFWSSHNNWKPLLTKGDDFRDPQFLVGPEINIPQNLTFKGFENTFVDDNLLDHFDVDANIMIKLTQELKNTKLLLIIIPVIQRLKLKEAIVTELIKLINELKAEVHEHKNVTSAIFISDKETVGKLKYYIKIDDTSISETKSIIDLANQSNGFEDCIAIDNKGIVIGNFTYDKDEAKLNYIPKSLRRAVNFSSKMEGLLILFEGENRVNLIWKGQRLISHRKSNWYLTPSNFEKLNTSLAQLHGVKKDTIDRLLTLAIEMTHIGEGGLLTLGDADEVIKLSVKKPNKKVNVVAKDVLDFGIRQWINILSQDGASIFDNDGILIEYMATIRPPNDVEIELETGKGTKHQTAQIVSHLTKSISIAISVDSNFTIYSKGKKVFRMNG
ncbi:MAG: hypothetical protein K1X49_03145 [Saprospiraceae bacterium]|jgi:hypothetical protein|nr:hypothetical protein [Saprospiraceae bacterium]